MASSSPTPPWPSWLQSAFSSWMKLRVQSSQPTDSAHDLNVDGVTGDLQRLNLGSKTQQASLFLQLFGQFMQDTFGQEALSLLEDRMDQFATDESSVDDEELTLTPRTSIAEAEEGKVHSEDKGKDCVFFDHPEASSFESMADSTSIMSSVQITAGLRHLIKWHSAWYFVGTDTQTLAERFKDIPKDHNCLRSRELLAQVRKCRHEEWCAVYNTLYPQGDLKKPLECELCEADNDFFFMGCKFCDVICCHSCLALFLVVDRTEAVKQNIRSRFTPRK